jgi:hypothetical protein
MKKLIFIASLMFSFHVLAAGESCSSDFQCESLCCHADTGTCGEHNPSQNIFCSKNSGESCVVSSMCKSESVVQCKIVKSGQTADGRIACTLRCPTVLKSGNCIDYTCVPPAIPPVPDFDPRDCSKAEDP